MAEDKEYLDLDGLEEYHSKLNDEFKELTIEEIEEAFQDMDETDPLYSVVYELISKANEAAELAKESATSAAESLSKMAKPATHETDGLMSAEDKIHLDEINDYTTSINLIRGTRDFNPVTEKLFSGGNIDGFTFTDHAKRITGGTFTEVQITSSSATTSEYFDAPIFEITANSPYTLFGEVMIESDQIIKSATMLIAVLYNSSGQYVGESTVTFNNLDIDVSKVGEWQNFVWNYTPTTANAKYLVFRGALKGSIGTIRYRKPGAFEGYINKPIWSTALADLALEPVNDITTGINLLRGTRDFTLGKTIIPGTTQNRYFDGFRNDGDFTFFKDKEGFTVAEKTQSYDASKSLDIYVPYPEFDCKYTVSFEMFLSEDYSTANEVFVWFLNNKAGSILKAEYIAADKLGIVAGKWCKIVYSFSLSGITEPYDNCYLGIRTQITKAGTIRVRKMKLEKGHIEHPEWSASPFDTNGPTTGINLINGTRDFVIGQNKVAAANDNRNDGFGNFNSFTITTEDGFGVATKSGAGAFGMYVVSYAPKDLIGNLATVFCEVRLENSSTLSESDNCLNIGYYDTSKVFHGMGQATLGEVFNGNLVDGVWTPAVVHAKLPSTNITEVMVGIFKHSGSGSVSFRRVGLYKGHINNPEWSASPFDVVQVSSLNNVLQKDVTSQITMSAGYVCTFAALYRPTPYMAQLNITVTVNTTIAANTALVIGQVNSSIQPINLVPIGGTTGGIVGVTGVIDGSGTIRIYSPVQIGAGLTLWISGVYVLKSISTLELPAGEVPVILPTID